MKVLVVEDNPRISGLLHDVLVESGYEADVVDNGADGLERAMTQPIDVILLDVMLPGIDGFEVCRRLRTARVMIPILIITARDTLEDKLAGLDGGADDYIVKPFEMAEMLARIRALLRRNTTSSPVLKVGDLTLDPATREAAVAEKTIDLSRTEYSLLEYFMRNSGRILTRSMLLDHIWQYDFGGNDNVLDVYISYLRRKIDRGRQPSLIRTIRGVGYRMQAP